MFWIVASAGALLVAVIATLVAGGSRAGGPPLAADSPAPGGSMALVEVLRQQGVTVTEVHTLNGARTAIDTRPDSTLFFADDHGYLSSSQLGDMLGLAPRTVVADPDFRLLDTLSSDIGFGGVGADEAVQATCDLPAAVRAETLSPGGTTLRLIGPADADLTGCFPNGDNTFSVIEQRSADRSVTLVAPSAVFRNDEIATYGNAALALNLLGVSDSVVWYLPTLADVPQTGPPSLGKLTPGWVTPVLVLLALTTLAAAIWRGRRFGPLVAENLPVTVKASETMEGRARLYARSSARLRALDALRIGSVQRLAGMLGLPRTAGVGEIALAVAAQTGRPPAAVRDILLDSVPRTDRDLLRLSDQLAELERATAHATTGTASGTSRPTPPTNGRMDI